MELTTIFNTRKSIRSFNGKSVSDEVIKKVLHAANASPVGMGKYDSVHLTIVRDKDILSEIESNTAQVFNAHDRSFLYNAPELIVVSTSATDNVGFSNAAIIAQDMILAAVDEGAGACHIWGCVMALSASPNLVKKLNLPEGFTPSCAIAIGETDETYTAREIPENRISLNYV